MLTDYLRARLRKIESLSFRVLAEDDRRQERGMEPLLSLEERDFAIECTFPPCSFVISCSYAADTQNSTRRTSTMCSVEVQRRIENLTGRALVRHFLVFNCSTQRTLAAAAPKLDLMVFADIGSKIVPDANIKSALTEDRRTLQPHERLLLPYSALSPSLMLGDSDTTLL